MRVSGTREEKSQAVTPRQQWVRLSGTGERCRLPIRVSPIALWRLERDYLLGCRRETKITRLTLHRKNLAENQSINLTIYSHVEQQGRILEGHAPTASLFGILHAGWIALRSTDSMSTIRVEDQNNGGSPQHQLFQAHSRLSGTQFYGITHSYRNLGLADNSCRSDGWQKGGDNEQENFHFQRGSWTKWWPLMTVPRQRVVYSKGSPS